MRLPSANSSSNTPESLGSQSQSAPLSSTARAIRSSIASARPSNSLGVITVLNSFAQIYLSASAMRRAVGLIVVFLALSACGNKAALYLPPPERDPQQNSKPAPRQ